MNVKSKLVEVTFVFSLFILSSCATQFDMGWAKYSVEKSNATGEITHILSRGNVASEVGMYLTLLKSTESLNAVMRVYVFSPKMFSDGESLTINIDGKIKKYKGIKPISSLDTDGYGHIHSYQSYSLSKDELQAMVNGQKVFMRVDLSDSYIEGDFSSIVKSEYIKGRANAKEGFPEFITNAWR